MAWVRLDDAFPGNPKVAPLSAHALQLYVFGLCFAAHQNRHGFLPSASALRLVSRAQKYIPELVDAGLWKVVDGGYEIHDFAVYNPKTDRQEEISAKRAAAGRLGGTRSKTPSKTASKTEANEEAKPKQRVEAKVKPPPLPTPLVETPSGVPTVFAQLEQVFGYRPVGGEAKLWGKLGRDLPIGADLVEAARRYQVDMPNVVLSAPALAKHYQRLMSPAWREKQRGLVAADFLDLVRSSDDGQGSSSHPRLGTGGVPADADIA